MWTRSKAETFFKKASDDAEDAFKEVGDSVKEAFSGIEDSLHRFQKMKPSWFASGHLSGGITNAFGQQVAPGASAASSANSLYEAPQQAPARSAARPAGAFASHTEADAAPAPAPRAAPTPRLRQAPAPQPVVQDGDDAMRRHCASLERLVVDLGISPQAARIALRHLDAWLVSEAGNMEMAAAEAAAHGNGEIILHVGDPVRLQGLVKNKMLNGAEGTLQSYGADSQRWKVALPSGDTYWVKSKLVKPLESRRLPLPEAGTAGSSGTAEEALAKRDAEQATALAAGWAVLEARQARLKAELEAREIMLLEREESLHKVQEALEARGLAEMEKQLSAAAMEREGVRPTYSFDDGFEEELGHPSEKEEMELISTAEGSVRTMGEEELEEDDDEPDEVWDMDWSTLGARAGAPAPRLEPEPGQAAGAADCLEGAGGSSAGAADADRGAAAA